MTLLTSFDTQNKIATVERNIIKTIINEFWNQLQNDCSLFFMNKNTFQVILNNFPNQ